MSGTAPAPAPAEGSGQPIVAVVGATGTGKSALALDLAERLTSAGRPAEIVNADAMQLYRGMDIGTAKVPEEERRGIPHHLLDVLDPADEAAVAWYQAQTRRVLGEILGRGGVPILVGGSGLYVSSVLFDFRFPGTDPEVRARLEDALETHGPGMLHRRLVAVDPEAASAIGPRNGRRLVRALEVIELTGEPFGAGLPSAAEFWRPAVLLGLRAPRAELVRALDARVEEMWRSGILDEVRTLMPRGMGSTASRAIGYAQALAQLAGEVEEREAIESTAALTRRYARRQVGWFSRYPQIQWLSWDDPSRVETALGRLDR
ncbi:tRNA (adenosine(37)-N6)-dimethylallyltransferase MiaA [Lysobacter korlensis]|uniref:tRNA dimethylallyltransferase n=1 Tax=Lysobacter korlensis TaxID=553636 RepID=A0ABV6RYR8_9GAMM